MYWCYPTLYIYFIITQFKSQVLSSFIFSHADITCTILRTSCTGHLITVPPPHHKSLVYQRPTWIRLCDRYRTFNRTLNRPLQALTAPLRGVVLRTSKRTNSLRYLPSYHRVQPVTQYGYQESHLRVHLPKATPGFICSITHILARVTGGYPASRA